MLARQQGKWVLLHSIIVGRAPKEGGHQPGPKRIKQRSLGIMAKTSACRDAKIKPSDAQS
jgi:hypothetical protein